MSAPGAGRAPRGRSRLGGWLRRHRTLASVTALAVLLAPPVTLAVLHEGFPLDDVDLRARDVWVTNGQVALAGRLNMQIRELNGSVFKSGDVEVLQDGDDVFLHHAASDSLERVDPSFTRLVEGIELPPGARVASGGDRIAVLAPDGRLWLLDATAPLAFDAAADPAAGLGAGSAVAITTSGTVLAYSTEARAFVRVDPAGGEPRILAAAELGDAELTTVGERAVALERDGNALVFDDGRRVTGLPEPVRRLQQPGPERAGVVVATNSHLLLVGFDGAVSRLGSPGENGPATSDTAVAAPAVVGACTYAAWASSRQYLGLCDGAEPVQRGLDGVQPDARLEFRVNRDVVALNNLATGESWLVVDQFVDVTENWDEVLPPAAEEGDEVDEDVTQQSLADTLAERTEENHAPVAQPDALGARPGRSTILPVLDNDSDIDGDVLAITSVSDIGAGGVLTIIEGGRALQLEPAPGASGTISFRYTVSDGRPGGTAETQVDVAVRPLADNAAPELVRDVTVQLEAGQTLGYDVLRDWRDPDGDQLLVTGAVSQTGDTVRFRPEGLVTFTHVSSELGPKPVEVTVSDGVESRTGVVVFSIVAPGTLAPVGTPDFATTFAARPVEVEPLANDLSPSGQALALAGVEVLTPGVAAQADTGTGVVRLSAVEPGTYYVRYELTAGPQAAPGIIRFDVLADPDAPVPPVAVTDTAFLRPEESVTVRVLANDLAPSGEVLGVQGFELPVGSPLAVELLGGTVLRVTAREALIEHTSFSYTISDGHATSTAGVTIVPVPALARHQAPLATPDAVTVRAGDVASVRVLANDLHPDGARLVLDPELVQVDLGDDGLAFVSGDRVRIQAPREPGQYLVTYRVTDAFDEAATARIVVTVTAPDTGDNRAPVAPVVEARVFQGASITIDVPLDGIDPDGDSVEFVGASGTGKGSIDAIGTASFSYTALSTSAGTDTFFYRVRDALGASAVGEVRIGVIPRGDATYPPSAVLDEVQVRPGRTTEVLPLANDSDPNGYPIALLPELLDVDPALVVEVDGAVLRITAPDEPGDHLLRYQVSNDRLTSTAYVRVHVDPEAPVLPPVARDIVVEPQEVAGQRSVTVNVLDGAVNPGGRTSDLAIGFGGPGAGEPELGAGGAVTVPIGEERRSFAYRLTNEVDDLTTWAFITVPRFVTAAAPRLRPELEQSPPVLDMDETRQWRLDDILEVPSGRPAIVIDADTAVALESNGDPVVVDEGTIRYTPRAGYRGTSAVTFTVTDGESADDETGNVAVITLPLVVGDPDQLDVAPTFADSTIEIVPGGSQTIDLRALADHPNPDVRAQLAFSGFTPPGGVVAASLAGDRLTVSAPIGGSTGATAALEFTVDFRDFHVPARIVVVVVASDRPMPQAVDDVEPEGRSNSTYAPDVLANDFNPYAADGEPLELVGAEFQGDPLGATLSWDAAGLRVTTGSAKSGTVTVVYRIGDATRDDGRRAQARLTIVVASAPEPVTSIALANPGSGTVTATFQPPSSSNGAEITGYTVRITGAPGAAERTDCVPGAACVLGGRGNGQAQTIEVAATNRVGTTWSTSRTITPYGTPAPPPSATASNGSPGTGRVNLSWSATPDVGGGTPEYQWRRLPGGGWNAVGTALSAQPSIGVGTTASFEVRVCNAGDLCSSPTASGAATAPPPPASASLSKGSAQTTSYCQSGACHAVVVRGENLPAGSTATIYYYVTDCGGYTPAQGCDPGGYPGEWYASEPATVNGSGVVQSSGRSFGFPGATIRVRILAGGVEVGSNSLTW